MEQNFKKVIRLRQRVYSVRTFVKRVISTLVVLFALSAAAVILLIYMPLRSELEKSLMDNFNQLSYIRHASLQNIINRGLEGARSLSSRTVIRDAMQDFLDGKISLDDLTAETQSKYEDGARALEYLIEAERYTGDHLVARYTAEDYEDVMFTVWNRLSQYQETATALCLTEGHEFFAVRSAIVSKGQIIGYDRLVFDLSDQIDALCTETIMSELVCNREFDELIKGAKVLKDDEGSSLYYKAGVFYHAFHMQDSTHFVTRQSEDSLLASVYRLSRQVLLVGIGVLLFFTAAMYFFVVRQAKSELEDGRTSLISAMTEANTDPLTKAGSRRFGEEFLSTLFERFKRGEPSPAVILFDIDSLKQINDVYGHSAGDLVICSIANAVASSIRSEDILLRWGGDEFIGVFAGLSEDKATAFAQKLLHTVSKTEIDIDGVTVRPTISIGISYFKPEDRSFIDVINRADRAMYQSKEAGRNSAHIL